MSAALALKRYLEDRAWVDERYDALAREYDGKYIAVAGKKVIAAADTIPQLRKKVKQSALFLPEDDITIVYVTTEPSSMIL